MAEINKIIGTAGPDSLEGTTGNDSIDALAGNDTIVAKQGGDDIVNAGAGDDIIGMGTKLTSADTIDGGTGTDTLYFTDSNSASNDLDNVTNVEQIILGDASTNITAKSTLVAEGGTLNINASALTNGMTFDGSAVVAGSFDIVSGSGNDAITGSAKADSIVAKAGGNDTITAGSGDDVIGMGDNMTSSDKIDGGAGNDTLWLKDADASTGTLDQVTNVENIIFGDAETNVTAASTLVASGKTINIDGSRIATSTMTFDGTSVAGKLNITGGQNGDSITGGANADTIFAGAGDDVVTGTAGNDWLKGNDGDDTFEMGTTLNKNVTINGGAGDDTLVYKGSTTAVATDLSHVQNVEKISLTDGAAVSLKSVDSNVYAGETLTVDGSKLTGATNILTWNGAAETDGNFVITGGEAADVITAGQGSDSVSGGKGGDTFDFKTYLQSTDTVVGGDGTDTLKFTDNGAGVNELKNVSGVDVIELGNAATNIKIWDGNVAAGETVTIGASGQDINTIRASVVIDGTGESDGSLNLYGGAASDSITGGYKADTIVTGSGDDTIIAKLGGSDSVDAGAGNDTLGFGDSLDAADTILGGTGTDTLWFTDVSSLTMNAAQTGGQVYVAGVENFMIGDGTVNLTLTGNMSDTEILTIDASALTELNSLTLAAAAMTDKLLVTGGAGADAITSGTTDDTIYGGAGADTIDGGEGKDVIVAGAGDDTIKLTTAAYDGTIDGGAGNDTLNIANISISSDLTSISNVENFVLAGDATISSGLITGQTIDISGGHSLIVNAGTSASTIDASNFTLTGTSTALTINGSVLDDNITGNAGKDTIVADLGNDTINAGAGDDIINGGGGNDSINAGAGADTITGGIGTDAINAGAGDDVIVITTLEKGTIDGGDGTDTLTSLGDAGDLTGLTSISNVEAINLTAGGASFTASVLSGKTLAVSGANTLTLDGHAATSNQTIDASKMVLTGANTAITGCASVDTITGTNLVDVITGGKGADVMDGGAGADTFNQAVLDTAVAANFAASATAATVSASQTTVGMDVISGFAAGDKIQLSSGVAITTDTTLLTEANDQGAATVGNVTLMQGTYDATAHTFVGDGTGSDSMLVYDTNGTTAGGTYEGLILLGYIDAGTTDTISVAGLFTAVA